MRCRRGDGIDTVFESVDIADDVGVGFFEDRLDFEESVAIGVGFCGDREGSVYGFAGLPEGRL